jgi:M-phase inducer tyrosine phosphatase
MVRSRTILIFHCEFSHKRAPDMWQRLRDIDRNFNINRYPGLFFPECYILQGGYSEFYN